MSGAVYTAEAEVGFQAKPRPHWAFRGSAAEVRFLGRHFPGEPTAALELIEAAPTQISWLDQRHSAIAVAAAPGNRGPGDGLWTQRRGLALAVATADCVPVVCASRHFLAVVHAGWRGLVQGVIGSALADLPPPLADYEAWLGPAIGPCCYEVSDDVAERVSLASGEDVRVPGAEGKPFIDLHRAAAAQLEGFGVSRVRRVASCTRCSPDLLWSYRGEPGKDRRNGRNLTLAWLDHGSGPGKAELRQD